MNDSVGVDQCKCLAGAAQQVHAFTHGKGTAPQSLRQVRAIQPFHGQLVLPVHAKTVRDIVDDPRMAQL